MKSLGLALTLFALSGALAALDLSGAHRVEQGMPTRAQATLSTRIADATEPIVAGSDQDKAAAEDDEADSTILKAFLLTPRSSAPANSSVATPLRYD